MNALLIGAAAMIIGGIKNINGAAIAGICLGIIHQLNSLNMRQKESEKFSN